MKQINNYIIEKLILNKSIKSAEKSDPENPATWKVGDILCGTWGYSMTLPAWYKIIKRTAKMFTVKQIPGKIIKGSRNGQWEEIADTTAPLKGEEIKARVKKYGGVKIDDKVYVHLWDGKTPLHGDDMD